MNGIKYEDGGSEKGHVGDGESASKQTAISDNQSGSPQNWFFPEPSFSSSMRRKKLAGSRNEIVSTE